MEGSESSYGGARVDEMLSAESVQELIDKMTPASRRSRRRVSLGRISTEALEAELQRRKGSDNVTE